MDILEAIHGGVIEAIKTLYKTDVADDKIIINTTKKEFTGDFTVVVFPFAPFARKKPEAIGEDIGNFLKNSIAEIEDFNVIKGFLNLEIKNKYWLEFLNKIYNTENYGKQTAKNKKVLVEYSSPNTNKPLHLGHIRNILLGWSVSKILEAVGYDVIKTQIVNDRGIAINKSMLAWMKYGNGETPESTGIKGDHLIGKYYVKFEQEFQKEYKNWLNTDYGKIVALASHEKEERKEVFIKRYKDTYFNNFSSLGAETKKLLKKWEDGDEETLKIWEKLNSWVYSGFDETYKKLGVGFDKNYYESETYLLGKDIVNEGLKTGIFYKKDDGTVRIDLSDVNLDEKIVLRSDGTSVYVTQDIGTAQLRYEDFGVEKMIYVVADEQNYHFEVLFEIMKRLGKPYSGGLFHLSYGMIDLPDGKMKSREGKVVDADDLIADVIKEARENAEERGELSVLHENEQDENIKKIAMGALKFFIIKVNPNKRMIFNPQESVDMQGQTGPYVQNAYVRIKSVLRKAGTFSSVSLLDYDNPGDLEKVLVKLVFDFPSVIDEAANNYDPSAIANYCYKLAQQFHRFYHDFSILKAKTEEAKSFRLTLSVVISDILKTGMELLGIEMPERM